MGGKSRLEAYSDGIFAIAATLLVLDLAVPKGTGGHLLEGLLGQWPAYAAYATSFLTIGIIWVNHHAVLERLARLDRGFMFLNLFLLLTVALIPFPTKVLAYYLQSGNWDANIAAAAYGVEMMVMGIAFSILSYYADARGLITVRLSFWQQLRFSIGLVMYLIGTLASLRDPRFGLVIYAGLALYYVVEPLLPKGGPAEPSEPAR